MGACWCYTLDIVRCPDNEVIRIGQEIMCLLMQDFLLINQTLYGKKKSIYHMYSHFFYPSHPNFQLSFVKVGTVVILAVLIKPSQVFYQETPQEGKVRSAELPSWWEFIQVDSK